MQSYAKGQTLLDIDRIIEKAGLEKDMKVADLGCGASGIFPCLCSGIVGKKGKVFAVDILKTVLEAITKRIKQDNLENVTPVWSDLEIFGAAKEVESGSLDVTLLINTLFQSQKRAQIIRESVRMLKKDGKLVIVDWKRIDSPFGPEIENRVRAESLREGAQKLGLKLDDEFDAGPYHFGMVFSKL